MRDRRRGVRLPGGGVGVAVCLLLPAVLAWSGETPSAEVGGKIFPLEEVSLQDCPEPARSRLQNGAVPTEWGSSPCAGFTYPAFRSSKPTYGVFTFDRSLFDPPAGLRYGYAVDESGGTGTGYDRLYFDLNHDGDLTNETPMTALKEPPAGTRQDGRTVWFEKIQVRLDYGPEGVRTQALLPRLMKGSDILSFVAPTARKGRIALGDEEVEVILAQSSTLAGRYDRPMIDVFFTGRQESLPLLGSWRNVKGTFYRLSASPAGDKIGVDACAGPFGTFALDAGDRNLGPLSLDFGWLMGKDAILDLAACQKTDGKWTVPAGDYRPFQLAIRYGQRRIVLRADFDQAGSKTAAPAVFPFRIRPDQSCTLDFSEKPEVVFRNPGAGQRVKAGETVNVEAVVQLPAAGTMIAGLDDTTRKTQSVKLPDGKEFDLFESVAPKVKIVNASGATVAEGEMPFGWGGTCGYSWRVPDDLKSDNAETFTITVTFDTSDLYGTVTGSREVTVYRE